MPAIKPAVFTCFLNLYRYNIIGLFLQSVWVNNEIYGLQIIGPTVSVISRSRASNLQAD
jgi:hypothetical protein